MYLIEISQSDCEILQIITVMAGGPGLLAIYGAAYRMFIKRRFGNGLRMNAWSQQSSMQLFCPAASPQSLSQHSTK